jgi:transposase
VTRSWIAGDGLGQSALLAVDARALLPAGHRVWDFLALVDELDLSAFEAAYRDDGQGGAPFHPRVMLALILYCRSKGLMSGRQVAAACYDDLGARVITGNQYPDRSTIDRFRGAHAAALQALLPQTLRLGWADGLVDVSLVAGDGTKIVANAAMGATVTEDELQRQINELRERLAAAEAAWLQQVGTETTEQPSLFTDTEASAHAVADDPFSTAWRKVRMLAGRLRARQAALAYLRAHPDTAVTDWAERQESDQQRVDTCQKRLDQELAEAKTRYERYHNAKATGGKLPPGPPPPPPQDHSLVRKARQALAKATARAEATTTARPTTSKVNTTDPASRIMPGKHDGYAQRHNIQALACRNQFIIAIGTHNSSNDKRALIDLIHNARDNLDTAAITEAIGTALFDNGYASADNFTTDLPVTTLLIAVEKEARQTGRRQDTTSTIPPAWKTMTERLEQPENRKLYKQRAAIIEPLFAQLFARFGRTLNLRGPQVNTELHIWAVTHNLLKIARHRRKHPG